MKQKRGKFIAILIFLIIFAIFFYSTRFLQILKYFALLPIKYFQIASLISIIGLTIAILGFYLIDKIFKIQFKKKHYIFIIFMSLTAMILSFLYFKYPYFDKLQHFFFPIMTASIIYHILIKIKLPKKQALVFTFFIVVSILAIFELIEYFLDILLDLKLQGVFLENPSAKGQYEIILNKIDDTMIDILTGTIGTIIYIISSLIFWKKS